MDPGDGAPDGVVGWCAGVSYSHFSLGWVPPEYLLKGILGCPSRLSLALIWAPGCIAVLSFSLSRACNSPP